MSSIPVSAAWGGTLLEGRVANSTIASLEQDWAVVLVAETRGWPSAGLQGLQKTRGVTERRGTTLPVPPSSTCSQRLVLQAQLRRKPPALW